MRMTRNARWFASITLSAAAFALAPVAAAQQTVPASFTELSGTCARSIAAGDGTSPWIISCESQGGGNYWAMYYDPANKEWLTTNGSGVEVGVAVQIVPVANKPFLTPNQYINVPLVAQASGALYWGEGGNDIGSEAGDTLTWSPMNQCTTSVSAAGFASAFGQVSPWDAFVIGCTAGVNGDLPLKKDNGAGSGAWSPLPGAATRISVSQDATELWSVNSAGGLYQFNGTNWGPQLPGSGIDVSAGTGSNSSNETEPPWMIDTNHKLNTWSGSAWSPVSGGGPQSSERVSVGLNGTVWIIDTSGVIWFYTPSFVIEPPPK